MKHLVTLLAIFSFIGLSLPMSQAQRGIGFRGNPSQIPQSRRNPGIGFQNQYYPSKRFFLEQTPRAHELPNAHPKMGEKEGVQDFRDPFHTTPIGFDEEEGF